jgi:hypothetical protein
MFWTLKLTFYEDILGILDLETVLATSSKFLGNFSQSSGHPARKYQTCAQYCKNFAAVIYDCT